MAQPKKTTESTGDTGLPNWDFTKDHYIYSTLSNDQKYTLWKVSTDGAPHTAIGSVLVHGRANVMNDKTFDTPRGVMTHVTGDQLQQLCNSGSFVRHYKTGYLTVERVRENPEKVAQDLVPKDKSAQLEPEDFDNVHVPKKAKAAK